MGRIASYLAIPTETFETVVLGKTREVFEDVYQGPDGKSGPHVVVVAPPPDDPKICAEVAARAHRDIRAGFMEAQRGVDEGRFKLRRS